jgi:TetR/AcrR family transcriptional repressor of nem operon
MIHTNNEIPLLRKPTVKSERTKARIIEATKELFLRRGVSGTTVDDVMREAEVSKGAFFYHFPSKMALLREVMNNFFLVEQGRYTNWLDEANAFSSDPLEQLLFVLKSMHTRFRTFASPSIGCLYAVYCYEKELIDDDILAIGREALTNFRKRIGSIVEQANKIHKPKVPLDPVGFADFTRSLYEGSLINSRISQDPQLLARQFETLILLVQSIFEIKQGKTKT